MPEMRRRCGKRKIRRLLQKQVRHERVTGNGCGAYRQPDKKSAGGKKTLVKGLKGKKGSYDAYLIPEGIEDYSYTKDGKEIKGSQYKVKLEFPKRKK